ncbi:MAG: ATP-binding protein [bacterium]|nr:ATP-binding protein [bacterium]
MYIKQKLLEKLHKIITSQKVIVIYGPRRTGKTTLINNYLSAYKEKFLLLNGDDIDVREKVDTQSIVKLKNLVGDNKLIVIDEAQKIPNIGLNLKIMVDNIKGLKIIATGSSSFDLANQIGEPLVGRKFTLSLFPLAQLEINQIENLIETKSNLENRLIYGSYPEIVITTDNALRERYLKEIISSYLYKDILELENIRHSNKISNLLRLIAFQIGHEVSFTELASQLEINKNTIEKYLDLLEKCFVLFSLPGFSRNLRKEITKNKRYYFYDNGIRNALINNFNPLNLRDDIGALWENYLIAERLKKQEYLDIYSNNYFWRTYDQKEIDLIEERSGCLFGYEIKWGNKKIKPPKDWLEAYANASFEIINQDNYLKFIC